MQSNQNSTLPSNPVEDDDIDLFRMVDIILNSKWLIIAISTVISIMAIVYAFLSQPVYQANTLIQVEQNQAGTSKVMGEMASLFDVESPASAEIEILRSRLVVGRAADQLQLYISASPDYLPILGSWLAKRATALSAPKLGGYVTGTEAITLAALDVPVELEGVELKLKSTEDGYLLKGPNGELLTEGRVGTISGFMYSGKSGEILVQSMEAKPGASFTIARNSRIRSIENTQRRLNISELGKQSGMIEASIDGKDASKVALILNAIGTAYVNQNIERKAAEAEKTLAFLDAFLPELKEQMQLSEEQYTNFRDQHGTFNLGSEGEISLQAAAKLQTKLLELQQKRRELAPRFQPTHPTIITLDKQIAAINSELGKIQSAVKKLPDLEQQLLSLMRNVKVNSEMYVNLLNSAQQLRLVKEGKVGNVRVVDSAVIPETFIKPNRSLIISVGVVFGLFFGVMAALLRNWLSPGLKDSNQIEAALGLHVFATVPHSPAQTKLHHLATTRQPGRHVLAETAPNDPAIEGLRSLRTALQFALLNTTNNIILITGPTPSIGKSFISLNFAATLAAAGKRVLLIDADLRKGYINNYLNLDRKNGFSELISGNLTVNEVLHRNIVPNVDFIATGVLPPNPGELLMSSTTLKVVRELSSAYDIVLLDTTPILAVSDAMALAPHAGAVFFLARAEVTTIGELEESAKRLRQSGATLKGVIFNDLKPRAHTYGTKYGSYSYTDYNYGTNNSSS